MKSVRRTAGEFDGTLKRTFQALKHGEETYQREMARGVPVRSPVRRQPQKPR